ncbi:hydroxyacid dehydrogenase [Streptomyces sp. NPDC058459]|uniref:hydroxyacid dehydrogenase n=1 Tax=Streptomyces sp. NPDC058459 TaxID=3346508 RepID=UPI00364F420F
MTSHAQFASLGTGAGRKPRAVLCMDARLRDAVFPADLRRQLAESAELTVVEDFRESAALAGADVLLTSWGAPLIDDRVLDRAPGVRAVLHAAGSVKDVVGPAVFRRDILVSSAAEEMAEPVAAVAYSFITLAAKKALRLQDLYRRGIVADRHARPDVGFGAKTIGIVGASRIGRAVIRRLVADGREVVLYDPYCTPEAAALLGAEHLDDLDEVCRRSQILSLHAPILPSTVHMINAARLRLLPDGAAVINTARGRLLDTEALLAECVSGRLEAYLDVTDPEPLPAGHRLHHLSNVLLTPHVAGTEGADLHITGRFAAEELRRLAAGLPLRGLVSAQQLTQLA